MCIRDRPTRLQSHSTHTAPFISYRPCATASRMRSNRAGYSRCIQRPTTRNDSLEQAKFEVCCHKYADLSEPSYGCLLYTSEKVYYGEITAEAAAQELFEEGNRIMSEAAAQ